LNKNIIILCIFLLLIVGCKPTPTEHVKQPIPPGVKIGGQISGIGDGITVVVSARSSLGQDLVIKGNATNGNWGLYVPITNPNYIIEAKATGYSSTPANYTIRLINQKPYIVNSDGSATKEASNLDFSFSIP
jgi:hypothetical protein